MPWPIPAPDAIASQAAGVYEGALEGAPDARSPNSVLGATTRVVGMATYGVYLGQAAQAVELWPDTAVDNLDRLAGIKGLVRDAASPASCDATMQCTALAGSVDVPLGTQATAPNNLVYQTTADVSVGTGPTTVPFVCTAAGSAGTLTAGTALTLVSPIEGLAAQTATVLGDANLTPGEDEESNDSLRARLLLAWRSDAAAGNAADWAGWVRASLPAAIYVAVLPRWGGLGNVGLALAMAGPAVPTGAQIAAVQAYVSAPGRCPVCAVPVVFAATLQPVNVTLHLVPSTAATQAAALAALQQLLLQQTIASPSVVNSGTLAMSALDAAVSVADGEFEHTRSAPAADVVASPGTLLTLGAVSFD